MKIILDTEKILRDHGILDVIQNLSANGESGTLLIRAGTTAGALFFSNGQLVDARVGNLTGFQAINAAASLRDATFNFDPSAAPPSFSSITPSERVVLKQFFGIDTVSPEESHDPDHFIPDGDDEVTLVGSNIPRDEPPSPSPYIPSSASPSSTSLYRSGLGAAAVVFLLAMAAVALLYKFGDYNPPAAVATSVQPSSPPVAEPVVAEPAVIEPVKPQVAPIDNGTSAARDLSGRWNVVNTVQRTSYSSFNNLRIGFNVSIEQNGKGFTGKGEKVSENGRRLPASSRTPIQVRGSIDGDRIEATFFEQGTARKTNGRFVWRVDKTGALTGTFITTAARSSGRSTATKEL